MSLVEDAIDPLHAALTMLERALAEADLETLLDCERDLAQLVPRLAQAARRDAPDRGASDRLRALGSTLRQCRRLGDSLEQIAASRLGRLVPDGDYGRSHGSDRGIRTAHALEAKV